MKAYLSLMGSLWSEKKQIAPISIGIYKPAIITFLILLCFVFAVKAQEVAVQATPAAEAGIQAEPTFLEIGDSIPEELWSLPLQIVNHPEEKTIITLGDYRNKLIILDFWATWCPPCIRSLHALDSIQKDFSENLIVIPVTYEDRVKIQSYIEEKKWSLLSVVKEKSLSKIFPHQAIPFQVWLKDGKVIATTHANQASHENIHDLIENNDSSNILFRHDNFSYNSKVPLFWKGNGTPDMDLKYQSVITGHLKGVFGGGGVFTDSLGRKKITILNADLGRLYRTAAGKSNRKLRLTSRLVIENATIQDLIPKGKTYLDSSLTKNLYTYELLAPPFNDTLLSNFMIEDLNRFFKYQHRVKGEIKMRKMPCWIISKTSSHTRNTEGGSPETRYFPDRIEFVDQQPEELISVLEGLYTDMKIPLVNEVQQMNINLIIPFHPEGLEFEEVRKSMERQGYQVQMGNRIIEMIVIDSI